MAPSDQAPHQPVSTSVNIPGGATVQSYYARRNMKIFPVADHELDAIMTMNNLHAILLTLASGFISLALGIWVTGMFAKDVTPEGEVLSKFGAWVLIGLGALCIGLCFWTRIKRKSIWDKIIEESKEVS
jgi:hypothetical protein